MQQLRKISCRAAVQGYKLVGFRSIEGRLIGSSVNVIEKQLSGKKECKALVYIHILSEAMDNTKYCQYHMFHLLHDYCLFNLVHSESFGVSQQMNNADRQDAPTCIMHPVWPHIIKGLPPMGAPLPVRTNYSAVQMEVKPNTVQKGIRGYCPAV